ncbi:MAG: methylated-DNA--protein-cysteine methyltransferase [Saprospiraceae bacterium]|nr:MAG: methylated-DNA--protein-cysteine methyltransferase [Saprospiraceae bacterium]
MNVECTYYHAPIGWLEINICDEHLVGLRRIDEPPCPIPPVSALGAETIRQLEAYFQRRLQQFDLPLRFDSGTPFFREVWSRVLEVPYGQTTTYGAIAARLGQPAAARAVGNANRHNPIAIVVPCHRVIASNGHLQGYFYGLDVKARLLQLENPAAFGQQLSLF